MKIVRLFLLLIILGICSAQARIGETHAEIALRYGPPIQTHVTIDTSGETEVGDLHEKNGMRIWVVYDDAGCVAFLRFSPIDNKCPITEIEVQQLLKASGPEHWIADTKITTTTCSAYYSDDPTQSRFGIWLHSDNQSTVDIVLGTFSNRRAMEKLRTENNRLSGF